MHARDILYHWTTSPVWVSSFQKVMLSSSLHWCPRKQAREHFYWMRGRCLISLPFIAQVQASSSFHNFANNYITTSQKSERCDHLVTVVVGECQSTVLNKAFKAWRRQAHLPSQLLPATLSGLAVSSCEGLFQQLPVFPRENERNLLDISKYF